MKTLFVLLTLCLASFAQDTLATKTDRQFYCGADNKWHCDANAPKVSADSRNNCPMPASGSIETQLDACRDSSWSCPVGKGVILRQDGKYVCRAGVKKAKRIPREAQ